MQYVAHEVGEHGQNDGEDQVQHQAGPHHLTLFDVTAGEHDGVGRGGHRQHEGAGGADGDQHGNDDGGDTQRLGDPGKQRHQQGGGGGVGDQFGQEHHECGQAEQNDEDRHGGQTVGEVFRQEGVGAGLLQDGA